MLRKTDTFGRWGGEEFILIIPDCEFSTAFSFLERLRTSIQNHEFDIGEKITFSAGISIYNGEKSAEEITQKADQAMYDAKKSGRNQVKIYSVDKN